MAIVRSAGFKDELSVCLKQTLIKAKRSQQIEKCKYLVIKNKICSSFICVNRAERELQ